MTFFRIPVCAVYLVWVAVPFTARVFLPVFQLLLLLLGQLQSVCDGRFQTGTQVPAACLVLQVFLPFTVNPSKMPALQTHQKFLHCKPIKSACSTNPSKVPALQTHQKCLHCKPIKNAYTANPSKMPAGQIHHAGLPSTLAQGLYKHGLKKFPMSSIFFCHMQSWPFHEPNFFFGWSKVFYVRSYAISRKNLFCKHGNCHPAPTADHRHLHQVVACIRLLDLPDINIIFRKQLVQL